MYAYKELKNEGTLVFFGLFIRKSFVFPVGFRRKTHAFLFSFLFMASLFAPLFQTVDRESP